MSNIKKMARPPGKKIDDPLFARAIETVATQEALEARGGVRYFTLLTPIRNQEKCQGCHGSDHRVRAVVRVSSSVETRTAARTRRSLPWQPLDRKSTRLNSSHVRVSHGVVCL